MGSLLWGIAVVALFCWGLIYSSHGDEEEDYKEHSGLLEDDE